MNKLIMLLVFIFSSTVLYSGIKFGPAYTEVSLQPGTEVKRSIYIENTYNYDINLKCFVQDFKKSRINKTAYKDWLKLEFNKENIVVKANSKKKLYYRIKLPKSFSGEASAKISFVKGHSGGTGINTKMSVAVYAISKNNSYIGADIKNFLCKLTNNRLSCKFKLTNTGNIHIRPEGYISVFNKKKMLIKKIIISKQYPLFEGDSFILSASGSFINKGENLFLFKVRLFLGYNKSFYIEKQYKVKIANNIVRYVRELK